MTVRALTEGKVKKGGRNADISQIKERPPAPGAINRPDNLAAQAIEPKWKCCGCGVEHPDRVRRCDCATNSLYDGENPTRKTITKLPNDNDKAETRADAFLVAAREFVGTLAPEHIREECVVMLAGALQAKADEWLVWLEGEKKSQARRARS